MNKSIAFLCVIIGLLGSFVWFASKASPLNPNSELCVNKALRIIAPWSSGCFYKAYFQDQPADPLVRAEQKMLARFAERGGVAADVLWYRSVFHQRFQNQLRTPFQSIHKMHLAYTKAQHIRIDLQVKYWEFLVKNDLRPLAQSTLNTYCDTYVELYREDIVDEINGRLAASGLPLSGEHCTARLESA